MRKLVLPDVYTAGAHLTRNVFAVGFPNDGVLLEDVVNQLRGDHNFNLSVNSLWTRIDELTGFPFLLIFHGRLRRQHMLRDESHQTRTSKNDGDCICVPLYRPKTHSLLSDQS